MEHNFTEIPATLPPFLSSLLRYPGTARYLALYYMGSSATWTDGPTLATFSYYSVFQPLKEHPAVAWSLKDANLGSDDEPPTHALICDLTEGKLLVGDYSEALRFVNRQPHTPPDDATLAAYRELMAKPHTLQDLHRRGMFEFLGQPDEAMREGTNRLNAWLDAYITEEVVHNYCSTNKMFLWHNQIRYLQQWIERCTRTTQS